MSTLSNVSWPGRGQRKGVYYNGIFDCCWIDIHLSISYISCACRWNCDCNDTLAQTPEAFAAGGYYLYPHDRMSAHL